MPKLNELEHTADRAFRRMPLRSSRGEMLLRKRNHLCLSFTIDPDAPRPGGFTHWVVYNIPPETNHIAENVADTEVVSGLGMQGKNDGGKIGYMGPAPQSGTHRYFFRLYALDITLDLSVRATHKEVVDAMKGHCSRKQN